MIRTSSRTRFGICLHTFQILAKAHYDPNSPPAEISLRVTANLNVNVHHTYDLTGESHQQAFEQV